MCILCSEFSQAPSCFDPDAFVGNGSMPGSVPGSQVGQTMNGIEVTDHAGSIATTAVLTLGVSEYGTIGNSTDSDWFRVSLVAGQTYEFRLLRVGNAPLTDPLLRVRDSAGVALFENDDAGAFTFGGVHGTSSRLAFTATTTGTFYIEADAFSTETGGYLLTGVPQTAGGMVYTIDEIAQQLTNAGESFFGSPESAAFNVGVDGQLTFNVSALTAEGQTLARAALITWSDLTGIQFVETVGAAEITFDDSAPGTTAFANTSTSGATINSANVMITTGWLALFGTGFNSYSYETYIHEIGHALGLAHGGNYNGSAEFGTDNYYLNDSLAYSIMSYMPAIGDEFGNPNTFVNADFRFMLTPVLADFVAIDRLYGSSTNTRTGNTTYGFNSNTGNARLDSAVTIGADVNFMVHDNGGTDTLDFSGSSAAQLLSLFADTFSSVLGGVFNLSISRETVIENARGGSGGDTIRGNNIANQLFGNGGQDSLFGFNGSDRLSGGAGADDLFGGDNVDTADYSASTARVVVKLWNGTGAGGDAQGDVLSGIENLIGSSLGDQLIGAAAVGNTLTGGGGADYLAGLSGTDRLNGGAGADTLDGGDDIDTADYSGSAAGVTVRLWNGTGQNGDAQGDILISVENVIGSSHADLLIGSTVVANQLSGGAGADFLSGLTGNDQLFGGTENDRLEGGGGADLLDGGFGFDTADYSASTARVIVKLWNGTGLEGDAQGDTLTSIESLMGSAHDDQLIGQINEGNTLAGAGGADFLAGLTGDDTLFGGDGNDKLDGGGGTDTLYGGNSADQFLFGLGYGHDTVGTFSNGVDRVDLIGGLTFAQLTFSAVAGGVRALVTVSPTNFLDLLGVTLGDITAADFI